MRYDHPGRRTLVGRPTSAGAALVVCAAATAVVLIIDHSAPQTFTFAGILVALGSYWWMVVAERRRPSLRLRGVVVAVAAMFAVALSTAPRESGDIWSYEIYGRMVAVHHASPYRHVPAEFLHDPMFRYVSPIWRHTGSVYGPAFTAFSAAVSPLAGDSATRVRVVYQATAALAVAGALLLLWRRTRSPAALAWLGLNPVVALHLVNAGRNDALIGLAILGAVLLVERERLPASGFVTGVAAVIKATGGLAGAGLAVWAWRHRGLRRAAALGAGMLATVAIAYALAGGTAALGPLNHAAEQVSQASVWSEVHRVGLPMLATTLVTLVTVVVVVVSLWRRTRDDPAEAGIAGPAAFLLAAPYVLPGYLGWVLPAAALNHNRTTSRIVALQATLLVGAYAVFHHQPPGIVGDAITTTTSWLAPIAGLVLLVAYLAWPRERSSPSGEIVPTPALRAS